MYRNDIGILEKRRYKSMNQPMCRHCFKAFLINVVDLDSH